MDSKHVLIDSYVKRKKNSIYLVFTTIAGQRILKYKDIEWIGLGTKKRGVRQLKNSDLIEPVITNYVPGAVGRITELHGKYYHKYWNFGLFFEAKVASELSKLLTDDNAHRNGFWIAWLDNEIVGGISVDGNRKESNEARLRFFIISSGCQGLGIGDRLMEKSVTFCKDKGFEKIYLTTFEGLDAARHLYEKWGFQLIEEKEDNTWGVIVKEQLFKIILSS